MTNLNQEYNELLQIGSEKSCIDGVVQHIRLSKSVVLKESYLNASIDALDKIDDSVRTNDDNIQDQGLSQ